MATATFGAGCFWKPEVEFGKVEGVVSTAVGYMGGHLEEPSYEDVCSGESGHTEVVHVEYDPDVASYDDLLEVFWRIHDPTQMNRQGPDVGEQYRSVVFYHTPEQRDAAERAKEALDASGRLSRPVATAVEPADTFYRAEEYHQKFMERRGGQRGWL